jgi:predicted metal-dependent enzyme (double-stranded beta helix superfamily)
MFDRDRLIADCKEVLDGPHPGRDMREVVARALADPAIQALGDAEGAIERIHRSADLTILNVRWRPGMVLMPHNHNMWAVIGIYHGREDNILWRRLEGGRIEAAGAKSLGQGETIAFGPEVIHSVINPLEQVTGAIHVYGGDFFAIERSEWDPDSLQEGPYDTEKARRMFAR